MPVLFAINLQTKFEMSSFIRSGDMAAHLGDSQHHKANTLRSQVVYEIRSLQL